MPRKNPIARPGRAAPATNDKRLYRHRPNTRRSASAAVLLATAACFALPACVGVAQAASPTGTSPEAQVAQTGTPQDFAIPAQPLSSALDSFADRAGLSFAYKTGDISSLRSPGVTGTMTVEDALRRLLAGTGITYRFTGDRSVTLMTADTGDGNALQLDPVTVEGTGESAYGPVDGYVATRSASGTKTDTPRIEVPQSLSVVTGEQMKARNVQTESEALLYSPGIFAQPYASSQSPDNNFYRIRGFNSAFGGSFVDGQVSPVNYRFEPFGFERIELLRGPNSVLYGQADPGGLVNRVTKRPTPEFIGEVNLQYGTFDRKQGGLDIGGPIDENGIVQFRLTGLVRRSNGAADYDFGQETLDNRTYGAAAVAVNPTRNTTLTLLASKLKDDGGQGYPYVTPDYVATHIRLDQDGTGDFDYDQYSLGYLFEHHFDESLTVRNSLKFAHMDYNYTTLEQNGYTTNGIIQRSSFGFAEDRRDLTTDTQIVKKLQTGWVDHTLLAGFDFQWLRDKYTFLFGSAPPLDVNNPDYSQTIPPLTPFVEERASSVNKGLYFQDQMKALDKWVLTLGGRQDWTSTRLKDELYGGDTTQKNKAFTYRTGLTYLADNGLAPYASYATSFLPTGGVGLNGPLEPTTGQQYEVGLKYEPKAFKGSFNAALFHLTKQNVTTPDPGGSGLLVQTGEVRSRGLELEATAEIMKQIRLQASYTFTDAKVTQSNSGNEGDTPALTPKHIASAWADYLFLDGPLGGLTIGAGLRYIGANYAWEATNADPSRHKNAPFTLVDAAVNYDLGKAHPDLEGASLAINVNNLLDHNYQLCSPAKFCQLGIPRTVIGTVRYRW